MYSENLKKIRKELNLTVLQLSLKIGVPANTISAYERKIRRPPLDLGVQLYEKLNINLNWFVSGRGEMFNQEEIPAGLKNQTLRKEVLRILKDEGIIN